MVQEASSEGFKKGREHRTPVFGLMYLPTVLSYKIYFIEMAWRLGALSCFLVDKAIKDHFAAGMLIINDYVSTELLNLFSVSLRLS